jgi:hypothetical protein
MRNLREDLDSDIVIENEPLDEGPLGDTMVGTDDD